MSRRQVGQHRRYSAKPKNNIPLIAGTIVLVVSVVGFGLFAMLSMPPQRGEDLCLPGASASHVIAVVVDASGEFTEVQREAFVDRFGRALTHISAPETSSRLVAPETRIDIYDASTSAGRSLAPLFSKCAPAPLTGLSAIVGNPRRAELEYRREFHEPLFEVLAELVGRPESNQSPILESLTAAAERSFQGRSTRDQQTMLLASDLLQNSEILSFYRGGIIEFDEFESQPEFNAVRPDLRGAAICPILISRSTIAEDRLQNLALGRWWEEYAAANRGRFDVWCLREFQI